MIAYAINRRRLAIASETMNQATDIDLAAMLTAGDTPDVVLLAWAGRSLPVSLIPLHRELVMALRLARGLVRISTPAATARLALAERLEQAARGGSATDVNPAWQAVVCASPPVAAMSAALLQAARRELSYAARNEPVLFAGWSDFYSHARFSTVPIGRALLSGAGITGASANEAMDALMTAVALIGLLQEAAQRYRSSGTMTLPVQWLNGESIAADVLARSRSTTALRKVFGRGIDRAHELLAIAGPARNLRGIGGHAAATSLLARRLLQRLARRDPLARPIALGLLDRLALRLANIH